MDDIAAAANISRRTVFRYFEKKHLITQAIVDDQAQAFFIEMQKALSNKTDDFKELLKSTIIYSVKLGPQAPGTSTVTGGKKCRGH